MAHQPLLIAVFSALTLANCSVPSIAAQEIAIIYPESYVDIEAPGGDGSVGRFQPGRLQGIYLATEAFPKLPSSYRTLTGFRWRPDGNVTAPNSSTIDSLQIRFSTTDVAPGDLSMRYADNIGDDETVVFDGPLTLSTQNTGPDGGPKDFDIVIDFMKPFRYDSKDGNLLMDLIWSSPFSNVEVDECTPDDGSLCDWVGHIGDPDDEFARIQGFDGGITQFIFVADLVPGDFDGNGLLDAADITTLSAEIQDDSQNLVFDVNGDGSLDQDDRYFWVHELRNTWFGDANLDDEFDTRDLVLVLASGTYDADIDSDWSVGDFDGNGRTSSNDLVFALADGGFGQGPRGAVNAVPEPTSAVPLCIGGVLAFVRRRTVLSRCLGGSVRKERDRTRRSTVTEIPMARIPDSAVLDKTSQNSVS